MLRGRLFRRVLASTIFVFLLSPSSTSVLTPAVVEDNLASASLGGCADTIGCVAATLLIGNDTLFQGNVPVHPRFYAGLVNWTFVPADLVVSPASGEVYVSQWTATSKSPYQLKAIDPASNKVASSLNSSGGSTVGPYQMAYSRDTGIVYFELHGALLGVNASSGAARVTSPAGYYSFVSPLTFDTGNGVLFVRAQGLNQFTAIYVQSVNDSTGALVSSPFLLSNDSEFPIAMSYGEVGKELYMVTGFHIGSRVVSGALYTIDPTSQKVVGKITLEGIPTGVVEDPRNGYLYVTNMNASVGVTVVDPTSTTIVARISGVSSIGGIAYDKADGLLYMVAGRGSSDTSTIQNVTVISDVANRFVGNITVGYGASDIAYNPWNQLLYVTNVLSGTLSVIYAPSVSSTTTTSARLPSSVSSTTLPSSEPASTPSLATAEIAVVVVAIVIFFGVILRRRSTAGGSKRV